MVAAFQGPDGDAPPILLVSLKAGGTGLNLTAASHVIHLDRWWNPAVEDQATDRAYRIGQRRTVLVHKLVSTGTVEERIDAMIARKRALAERVVGTGEEWITALSTDELREVVALRRRRGGGRLMAGRGRRGRDGAAAAARGSSRQSRPGRGRPRHVEAARRDGGDVVVAAVRRGARVVRPRRAHAAGPPLRPPGQVISLDVEAGLGARPRCRAAGRSRTSGDRGPRSADEQWDAVGPRSRHGLGSPPGCWPARCRRSSRRCSTRRGAAVPARWRPARALLVPDWENPCKHIAAVLYVFADQLDDDPWLLLAWRGRDREAVLGALRARRRPAADPVTMGCRCGGRSRRAHRHPPRQRRSGRLAALDRPDPR